MIWRLMGLALVLLSLPVRFVRRNGTQPMTTVRGAQIRWRLTIRIASKKAIPDFLLQGFKVWWTQTQLSCMPNA